MAKNWSASEAVAVLVKGEDKASIQDIGRRFPLFAHAASSGTAGLVEIIMALPERQTARTIESKFKEGLDEEAVEEMVEEVEKEDAKPAKPAKGKKGKKGKKVEEPVVEEDEEDEEDEEEEEVVKAPKGKKGKKGKKVTAPVVEEEDEDEDEDEEDDEDEVLEEMSLVELKKEAKKLGVNIKGLKKPKEIIKAIKSADDVDEDEDEDEDDEDWDI